MVTAVGRNAGVVMPTAGQVTLDVVYGWPDTRTGTNDSTATAPAAPVLTGVVDGGDQDSAVASVTTTPETNTVQLYYRQKSASAWTEGLTREGSGDIVQTGLTGGIWYEFYATATNPAESGPSILISEFIAAEAGAATLKQAIYAILTGDDTVNTLLNGGVTPGGDPTEGTSSISYHAISMDGDKHTMDGPDTLAKRWIQVNSYGASESDATLLSDAVRGALDGYSGTVSSLAISYIALVDDGDLNEFEPGNRKISRHGIRQEYSIIYTRN